MKKIMTLITVALLFSIAATAQAKTEQPVSDTTMQVVEASCGMCQLGMKGDDCALAVRINGETYYVDGTKIDDHGDAHAADGFCQAIRKAEVKGKIVDGRFKVNYFKLLPKP